MTWPPVGIETSTPLEICGSRPIVTNSVVPMAKPPIASATTARPKWRAVTDGASRSSARSVAAVVMVITGCKTGPPGRYSPRALRVTRHSVMPSERGERLVEGRRRTHHGGCLLGVGTEVAADVGRLALHGEQLVDDLLLVGAQRGGEVGERRGEVG